MYKNVNQRGIKLHEDILKGYLVMEYTTMFKDEQTASYHNMPGGFQNRCI